MVALDKDYEAKSHAYAEKFLQDHPKRQEPTFFAGVDAASHQFMPKNEFSSSVADMLGAIDTIADVSAVSNNFLGKISEIKSAVEGN